LRVRPRPQAHPLALRSTRIRIRPSSTTWLQRIRGARADRQQQQQQQQQPTRPSTVGDLGFGFPDDLEGYRVYQDRPSSRPPPRERHRAA
jgi:hypothetical protein